MNPTKPSTTTKASLTAAADRILAEAKRVAEMPPHQIQQEQEKNKPVEKAPFEIKSFILQFEQDAIAKKFGSLGTGPYDKLLIEKIRENMEFVPERDKEVHTLISESVKRFDNQTRGRV